MLKLLELIFKSTRTFAPYQAATTNVAKLAGSLGGKLPFEAYTTLTKAMHDAGKVSEAVLEITKK